MSLTCHEEIGRVGRVRRGCYEDASDSPQQVVRVHLVEFGERLNTQTNGQHLHRSRPPADQSRKRVAS